MAKIKNFILSGLTLLLSSYFTYNNIISKPSKTYKHKYPHVTYNKKHKINYYKIPSRLKSQLKNSLKDLSKDCVDKSTLKLLQGTYYYNSEFAYGCSKGKKFNNQNYPSNFFEFYDGISTCDGEKTSFAYYQDKLGVGTLVDSNNSIITSNVDSINLNPINSTSDFICSKDINGSLSSFAKFLTDYNHINYINVNSGEVLYPYNDASISSFHHDLLNDKDIFYAYIYYDQMSDNVYDILHDRFIFETPVDNIEELIPILNKDLDNKVDYLVKANLDGNLVLATYLDSVLITNSGSEFNDWGPLDISCGNQDYRHIITYSESKLDYDNNSKKHIIAYDLTTHQKLMDVTGSKILSYSCNKDNNSLIFLIDHNSGLTFNFDYNRIKILSTSEYLYNKYVLDSHFECLSYDNYAYSSSSFLTYYNLNLQSFEEE